MYPKIIRNKREDVGRYKKNHPFIMSLGEQDASLPVHFWGTQML